MKTYYTSDTHFGHAKIIDYCDRPYDSVEEMNEGLLEGINQVVSSKDRLVITGDIVMGKLEESLKLLGRIQAAELILLPGNHDRWSPANAKKGKLTPGFVERAELFRRKYEAAHPNCIALHAIDEDFEQDGTTSWHVFKAWDLCQLMGGWKDHPLDGVRFSHFPYAGDSHDADRYTELRPEGRGPLVHGHVHTEWQTNGEQFNVGVDVNDYKPVSEETLIDWVRSL